MADPRFAYVERPIGCDGAPALRDQLTHHRFGHTPHTVHGDRCQGWQIQGCNTKVKDSAPSGWSDNCNQWIRTTAKVEKVVPA